MRPPADGAGTAEVHAVPAGSPGVGDGRSPALPGAAGRPAGPTGLGEPWGAVHAVYQPVVELSDRTVVGYEALARGAPDGAARTPDALFAAARAAGQLAELDWSCRLAALRGALEADLPETVALFVNVEPQAMQTAAPPGAQELLAEAGRLRVVMEITERALTEDPAGLLRAADAARARGWRVALDDVGADRASLALLPFLRPDVIKLDLRLVQAHTTVDTAEIITAVNAEAERTGALVLAEGIETEDHAQLALMMGASLGQGWLFGRPAPLPPAPAAPHGGLLSSSSQPPRSLSGGPGAQEPLPPAATPYELVEQGRVRRSTKPLLRAISRQLERQALAMGETAVVLGTFQQARHFTASTARRYATLAAGSPFVAVYGTGLGDEPAAAVRGVDLPAADPLTGEWDVVVVGPHFTGALLAQDLGDSGPDSGRRFDYQVTYDRATVLAAAELLMHRVPSPATYVRAGPRDGSGSPGTRVGPQSLADVLAPVRGRVRRRRPTDLDAILTAAVRHAPHGVSVADARHPDHPLVWVNAAFSSITGHDREQALDRNCRFLQGDGTDREAVRGIADRLRTGRPVRTTVLNYRRDGTPFWNDLQITPVHDRDGELTHYVGQQNDVTDRTHAQQRADYLAHHDPLTGLGNRTQLHAHLATEVVRASRAGTAVALLYLDVDHFKPVNDTLGHAAGDQLLQVLAARLRSASRGGDLLARVGGDEFVLVVSGLREHPRATALERADDVLVALLRPLALPGHDQPVRIGASIGVSLFPYDADGPEQLLDHADQAMYAAKTDGRNRAHLYRPGGDEPDAAELQP